MLKWKKLFCWLSKYILEKNKMSKSNLMTKKYVKWTMDFLWWSLLSWLRSLKIYQKINKTKTAMLVNFFELLSAFLLNFFLCLDRWHGDVSPHLAQPCYVAPGRALDLGLYPDLSRVLVCYLLRIPTIPVNSTYNIRHFREARKQK